MKAAEETARSLFDRLSEVASAVRAANRVFLLLDFDGTLAPIVEEPEAAAMPAYTRERLIDLARRKRFRVAIVSGRSLADVEQRVGLDGLGLEGLVYAGNHGLEISGPGLRFVEPAARERIRALQSLSRDLEIGLRGMAGTRVEDKVLTVSVHYRKARKTDRSSIRRIAEELVDGAGGLFQLSEGLEVLEIRPRVNWNKGTAARWILESSGNADALPIYMGDDATDEDAFAALAEGITVRVGLTAETQAQYQLDSQEAVGEFLAWLAELDDTLPDPMPEDI
jgi:trehalose 6-phosphate phosphatase